MRWFLCTLALLLTACAHQHHGSLQTIGVTSSPDEAVVRVNGVAQWTTPAFILLPRRGHHTITVELDGYAPYTITLRRRIVSRFWVNLLTPWSPIGLLIDAATGAMYELEPDRIVAELKWSCILQHGDIGLYLFVELQPQLTGARKIGQMSESRRTAESGGGR